MYDKCRLLMQRLALMEKQMMRAMTTDGAGVDTTDAVRKTMHILKQVMTIDGADIHTDGAGTPARGTKDRMHHNDQRFYFPSRASRNAA